MAVCTQRSPGRQEGTPSVSDSLRVKPALISVFHCTAVRAVPVEDLGVLMVRRVDHPAGLARLSDYIERGERGQDAAA
jgi:hypothetical protein